MRELGKKIRERVATNGRFAKALTILYVLWFIVLTTVIVHTYGPSRHGSASTSTNWLITGVSILGLVLPAFISILQENIYMVHLYGPRDMKHQAYLKGLDERQLQSRREVFEKSYAILATLVSFFTFVGSHWFFGLSANGTFAFTYSIFILFVSLPSLVAVWDTGATIHSTD